MAIASTNNSTLSRLLLRCSSSLAPESLWRWGTSVSAQVTHKAPANTPRIVMGRPFAPPPYSTDGRINPSTAAASMTPEAKERIISVKRWEIFLKAKPISAPTMVAPPTPRAVNNTNLIGNSFYSSTAGQ